jgi:hypothetical protein
MVLLADTFAGGFEAEAFIETSARNPAIQGGEDVKLPPRTHAKQHFRALPYAEIPEFMRRLRAANVRGIEEPGTKTVVLDASPIRPPAAATPAW